ncbi:hypothetical protein AB4089_22150 [Arthrobacter sp. 2MCAF15]|uniref:hypothetical protein n=1 Tax=Arthrobacter sp. 2MCAF15 TaxID=3232984 RepID=UPI003F8DF54F
MTIKINDAALRHARQLIKDARIARDTRDDWSEHAPDTEKENAFIAKHGHTEYGTWHLGEDTEKPTTPRDAAAFPLAISGGCTAAPLLPSRAGPPRTTTTTSPRQQNLYSTSSTRTKHPLRESALNRTVPECHDRVMATRSAHPSHRTSFRTTIMWPAAIP